MFALGCIKAYRRGDSLPARPREYLETREFAELYLEEIMDGPH
jgi:hypothetical protein